MLRSGTCNKSAPTAAAIGRLWLVQWRLLRVACCKLYDVTGHMLSSLAERIATEAHAGQTDKAGVPYITHPRRVASRLAGDDLAQATAWLHDVLEDTSTTSADLVSFGIPSEVVSALEAVTKGLDELPEDYYARVRANPLALKVKLADIADNSDPARLGDLPAETAIRLREKYAHAIEALNRV